MSRKDGVLALLVVVVWGLNFVVIKVGLHNMPPLMLAGLRFMLVAFPAIFFVARPKVPLNLLLGYGLTISFAQIMSHSTRPAVMSLVIWSALIPIIPFFVASLILDGSATMIHSLVTIDMTTILSLMYLAFVATIVGYGIWGTLLGRYETWRVAPLSLLVPVVGLASAALLLDERLTGLQFFGAVLIMTGLYINVFGLRWRKAVKVGS